MPYGRPAGPGLDPGVAPAPHPVADPPESGPAADTPTASWTAFGSPCATSTGPKGSRASRPTPVLESRVIDRRILARRTGPLPTRFQAGLKPSGAGCLTPTALPYRREEIPEPPAKWRSTPGRKVSARGRSAGWTAPHSAPDAHPEDLTLGHGCRAARTRRRRAERRIRAAQLPLREVPVQQSSASQRTARPGHAYRTRRRRRAGSSRRLPSEPVVDALLIAEAFDLCNPLRLSLDGVRCRALARLVVLESQ